MTPRINPKPARPPANDPNDARFWDERDLEGELRRVFEVCHSCRMCVNFCGTFPDVFARVDRDIEKRGAHGSVGVEFLQYRAIKRKLRDISVRHFGEGARGEAIALVVGNQHGIPRHREPIDLARNGKRAAVEPPDDRNLGAAGRCGTDRVKR